MKKLLSHGLAALVVSLLAACGGGSSDSPSTTPAHRAATSLSYTDPTGSGWRLVKQEGSTSTRVVLGLVGPASTTSRGVGFNLNVGRGAKFSTFADGGYAHDTGVFQLKGSNPSFEPYAGTDADPVLFASRMKSERVLTTGIFQKDRSYSAKALTKPVVQIAVEFDSATGPSQGQLVGMAVLKARMIPDDIGGKNFTLDMETLAKAKMADIEIEVGKLVAN